MAIEPSKHQEQEVPEELVMQHTFHARDDIRGVDKRTAEKRFLEALPDDPEDVYDEYETEEDMEADRRRRKTGLLNEPDDDAGGSESEPPEDDTPPEEVEEEDFEEGPDFEEEDDSLDGEVEEDEEFEEYDEELVPVETFNDLPGDVTGVVKVDGEEVEVTLEELTSSYSYQAHNTRTAQQLAAEKKEFEEQVAQTRQERERYAQGLAAIEQDLIARQPEEPDWDALEKENPTKFAVERAKWDRRQEELRAVRAEQARAAEEARRDFEQNVLPQERNALLEAVPEWKDPEVMKSDHDELIEFAVKRGFDQDEVLATTDHRMVLLLRDAMRYENLAKKGKKVAQSKRKRKKAATLKPGGGSRRRGSRQKKSARRDAQDARRRLAESGKFGAATEFLLESDLLD